MACAHLVACELPLHIVIQIDTCAWIFVYECEQRRLLAQSEAQGHFASVLHVTDLAYGASIRDVDRYWNILVGGQQKAFWTMSADGHAVRLHRDVAGTQLCLDPDSHHIGSDRLDLGAPLAHNRGQSEIYPGRRHCCALGPGQPVAWLYRFTG